MSSLVVLGLVVIHLVVYLLKELMLVLVVGDHGMVLVVDGAGVSLVLKFYMGLLQVVFLMVRVVVSGLIDVDGVLVNDLGVVVVLVVGHTLNEVMGRFFMVVTVIGVVVMVVIMMVHGLVVVSVVSLFLVVGLFVMGLNLVVGSNLIVVIVVMGLDLVLGVHVC